MIFTIQQTYGDIIDKSIADLGCGCGMLSIAAAHMGSNYNIGFDVDEDALQVCLENVKDHEVDVDLVQADIKALRMAIEQREKDRADETEIKNFSKDQPEIIRNSSEEASPVATAKTNDNTTVPTESKLDKIKIDDNDAKESKIETPPQKSVKMLKMVLQKDETKNEDDDIDEEDIEEKESTKLVYKEIKMDNIPKIDVVMMNPPFGTRNTGIDVEFLETALKLADTVYSLHKTSTRKHLFKRAREWKVDVKVVAEVLFDIPQMYKFHKHKSLNIQVDLLRFSKIPSNMSLKSSSVPLISRKARYERKKVIPPSSRGRGRGKSSGRRARGRGGNNKRSKGRGGKTKRLR
mmetsp:Transcript_17155/g.25737  ORF Transcript_17155/g.25737 Transcript_17155/m.25737 type:complete len:349 (-) Transcript_17155:6-1052(-)